LKVKQSPLLHHNYCLFRPKKKSKSDEISDLNIDGDGAQLGISKKKKGKKAKLSKEEKAAVSHHGCSMILISM